MKNTVNMQLIIDIANGQVRVSGPIHDKVLCYGLLEAAKDAIRDFRPDAHPLTLLRMDLPGFDNGSLKG